MSTERRYAFALCYVDRHPLSCRTGYMVLKTYRKLATARDALSRTTGPGYYVGERQGSDYVRLVAPWNT